MNKIINTLIQVLKDHVSQNNHEIQHNQDDINRMLSDNKEKLSSRDLEYKNSLNKELLAENEEFIQMQLQLSEFVERFGHLFPATDSGIEGGSFVEKEGVLPYFDKTISGQISYGPGHPQFHNIHFFKELLRYYEEREEYEKCEQIIRVRNSR